MAVSALPVAASSTSEPQHIQPVDSAFGVVAFQSWVSYQPLIAKEISPPAGQTIELAVVTPPARSFALGIATYTYAALTVALTDHDLELQVRIAEAA